MQRSLRCRWLDLTFSFGTKVPLIKRARIERDCASFREAEGGESGAGSAVDRVGPFFAVSPAFFGGSIWDFRSSNFAIPAESSATLASASASRFCSRRNVLDYEILQLAGEFCGAFLQRLQVRAFHFVAALHLADQQF